jgi:hypothetical protein
LFFNCAIASRIWHDLYELLAVARFDSFENLAAFWLSRKKKCSSEYVYSSKQLRYLEGKE